MKKITFLCPVRAVHHVTECACVHRTRKVLACNVLKSKLISWWVANISFLPTRFQRSRSNLISSVISFLKKIGRNNCWSQCLTIYFNSIWRFNSILPCSWETNLFFCEAMYEQILFVPPTTFLQINTFAKKKHLNVNCLTRLKDLQLCMLRLKFQKVN